MTDEDMTTPASFTLTRTLEAPRALVWRAWGLLLAGAAALVTADRIAVAGTHLPFPGIGHVEARGDAFAWVPEDWFATRA